MDGSDNHNVFDSISEGSKCVDFTEFDFFAIGTCHDADAAAARMTENEVMFARLLGGRPPLLSAIVRAYEDLKPAYQALIHACPINPLPKRGAAVLRVRSR